MLHDLPTLSEQIYLMPWDKERKPETWNFRMGIWVVLQVAIQTAAVQRQIISLLSRPCDNAAYTFPLNPKLEQDSKSSK